MREADPLNVAMIVAHPDDETIWAGGTVLANRDWNWHVVSVCRASDPDRAPKFYKALAELGASGVMGDVDDEPDQHPILGDLIQRVILSLLPQTRFDLIVTHSPFGEYTRHRRHEEVARAVADLWKTGRLESAELWMFAYRDGGKGERSDPSQPILGANRVSKLAQSVWRRKRRIVSDLYGFGVDSFEAEVAGPVEAFWRFHSPADYERWTKSHARPRGRC